MASTPIPFATDARMIGLAGTGIALNLRDQDRTTLCRSLVTDEVAEQFAYAILGVVHANRARAHDAALTKPAPRSDVSLMRHLRLEPVEQTPLIIRDAPSAAVFAAAARIGEARP